eukprot:SAG31_NODE_7336_length_1716_cov_1.539889_2_plen_207_part_00
MGKDKYENDMLIENGWPEDIWFHVDSFSSAHVYLRLPRGPERKQFRETGNLEHMPEVLAELCALVKANSIAGSKQSSVAVVYTPWENLRKGADMDYGTVGFKDRKKVVKVNHVDKQKDLVKRLEATQREEFPDLRGERQAHDKELQAHRKSKQQAASKAAKESVRKSSEEVAASRAIYSATKTGNTVDFLDSLSGDEEEMDMDELF